jgi:hypothetical protein
MTTTPDFRALLADDAYAASFQSMGQYRTALLKALATPPPEPGKVTAWMYQGEDNFDGMRWRENWEVTIDEKLARFKSGNKEPIPLFKAHDLAPPPKPPTDEELLALKEKLWDKYKTIPYQWEEFMYGDAFESALSDYRAVLERWGK